MAQDLAEFIVVFLNGFIPFLILYLLWFFLKKKINISNFYKTLIVCFSILLSLTLHYKASFNIVGYQIMQHSLEEINNQKIKETGSSITLQEENELKEKLSQNEGFKRILTTSSFKMSLFPSILSISLMSFLFYRKK